MVKRNRLGIMAEILSFCKKPQTRTGVMYGTNLSWRMFRKYLYDLLSLGLLKVYHRSARYVTTRKGHNFLRKYDRLKALLTLHGDNNYD